MPRYTVASSHFTLFIVIYSVQICETHCDVDSIIDKACTDVHLC